jgi:sugar lactone lactonase YvrE
MERLIKNLLFIIALLAPVCSNAAETKAFKHIVSLYTDDKDVGVKAPEGVACNDKLDFIVADTGNGRLLRYKLQDGKLVGGTEIRVPEMPYPVRLQLGSKGDIFALDEKLRRIVRLNPDGAFAGYVEPQGVPAPTAVVPRSFKLDASDTMYVLDIAGDRVLALDPAGKYLKQTPLPKKRGFFSDLTVTSNGDIYLLDSVNAAIYLAAKGAAEFVPLTKDLPDYATFPTYVTTDNRGILYLVDQHGNAIVTVGYDGSFLARRLAMGWKDSQVNYPSQICLAGGNILFITDRNNNKVQIFEVVK